MPDTTPSTGQQQQPEPGPSPQGQAQPKIDLALLAEKVYRLMLEDVRLEQARAGRSPLQRGGNR